MNLLFFLFIANIIYSIIDPVITLVAALLIEAPVNKISFFTWPIIRFDIGSLSCSIGWIPIGGFVGFRSIYDDFDPNSTDSRHLEQLSAFKRFVLAATSPLIIFLFCAAILSPQIAFVEMLEGCGVFFRGAFNSVYSHSVFDSGNELIARESFGVVIIYCLTKFLGLNLLPIPPFRGFSLLWCLIMGFAGRELRPNPLFVSLSIQVSLVIVSFWLLALIGSIF